MPAHNFLSQEHLQTAQEITSWAQNYLMKPDDKIKRPYGDQVVCPFVKSSLESNSLYMAFHDEVNGEDFESIADVIIHYIDPFKKMKPRSPNKEMIKKALLVVFPNISPENCDALDMCHALIKPAAVANALMVGQFHPKCTTPARHNPTWNGVSVAPFPMIAMRNMAIHDILFLGNDSEWFNKYNLIYGSKFTRPDELDEHDKPLVKYFKEARAKFL